ncbi:MAG: hypothetical protein AMS19_02760 [Gemmatimonas sp. SG8_23]|nr:MAG: hypothetical protein AMS19_02760 [Gemmatimonas sp. SG8_23]
MNRVNWSQAVAEVLLLAIGIGLALLADSWWQQRQERVEEQSYLTALHADFSATRDELARTLEDSRGTRDHVVAFLELLSGDEGSVPVDSLERMVEPSFWWWDVEPVLATYQDMVNSGDLRLIQNGELRVEMAAFLSFLETIENLNDASLLEWKDLQAPFMIDRLVVTSTYSDYGERDFPKSRHRTDPSAFWDGELENILAIKLINLEDQIRNLTDAQEKVGRVLSLIEGELAET